jgi:hypothetical protein
MRLVSRPRTHPRSYTRMPNSMGGHGRAVSAASSSQVVGDAPICNLKVHLIERQPHAAAQLRFAADAALASARPAQLKPGTLGGRITWRASSSIFSRFDAANSAASCPRATLAGRFLPKSNPVAGFASGGAHEPFRGPSPMAALIFNASFVTETHSCRGSAGPSAPMSSDPRFP